ncbi:hypothetical protein [Bdellovibrio sp. KM01]|uniref:hypothetical protein n=1 Tax=Bdellovibrio sp. KM01 TaxID=2748865 RepID=UPI002105A48B|nr:hypothetical protein [Bdellovibrio sp. KM01]
MKIKMLISTVVFALSFKTFAQNAYVSTVDQDLAIKSIVLVPTTDNIGGIYAKPVEEQIRNQLNEDKQWSLVNYPKNLEIKSETLDENPAEVQKLLQTAKADAAITSKIIRGPRGISITLTLFVGREGLPLTQETLTDYKGFDTADIKMQASILFNNIKNRMPFRAVILSRRGQQVTLNLGSNYGLKPDSRVSVVQIIKVNRHPKLKILVSTEKEVLGRVKLFKVEPYLSFGYIELEKEPGVIGVGSKVMPDEFVKYATPITTPSGKILTDVTTRPDKDVAFGDDPKEWTPEPAPQYGKVEVLAGFSSYTQNVKITSPSAQSISGNASLAPNLLIRGELWLNPEWFVGASLRQSVFSIDNSLAGSSPSSLNESMSQYSVTGGYNFLLSNDFFGPKIQVSAGYQDTNFKIDDSTPVAFTSNKYGGLLMSLGGSFPLGPEIPVELGGRFDLFLNPTMSESPNSGGGNSSKINSFSFFGNYRLKQKFAIKGELLFENFSSDYKGGADRSTVSHKMTTLMGGIQYLF